MKIPMSKIDSFSLSSYMLNIYKINEVNREETILLSHATGFIYKKQNNKYLITNLHVTSGQDIFTKKIENKYGCRPDFISCNVSVYDDEQKIIEKYSGCILNISLYDEQKRPNWLIHPRYGRTVDVAVIPLLNIKENIFAINESPEQKIDIHVADDVFVIGYPLALGASENRSCPVWKNAVIASEPSIEYFLDGRKCFLIDGTTRSGMSGSPVIRYSNFTQVTGVDGSHSIRMHTNKISNFLGIYSGRLNGNTSDESFLGLVWKKEIIDEIIAGNRRDDKYED